MGHGFGGGAVRRARLSSGGAPRRAAASQGRGRPAGAPTVLQLRPNFFMIAGAGGNVGVQIGDDGVVVVDSGSAGERGRGRGRDQGACRPGPSAT